MVYGLDLFIRHFESFSDHYILIGGGACDWQMEQKGLPFRATKDLDIILVVEALSDEFVQHFWTFIKEGEYALTEINDKKVFYRFLRPKSSGYPKMIELFSRKPDPIKAPDGFHLTDIPTSEEASSLSAILLDDDYYQFTLANSILSETLHHANEVALICLKAKAFLNNTARRASGQVVQDDDITKHKKDVIRLAATLAPATKVDTPETLKTDLRQYIAALREENPDIQPLLKNQGMSALTLEQITGQLETTFGL